MSTFPFGYRKEQAAAELRAFADKLESGEITLSSLTDSRRRTADNFEVRHFVMRYHQRTSDSAPE